MRVESTDTRAACTLAAALRGEKSKDTGREATKEPEP